MNYIGSKYSLLDFLQTTIDQVCGLNPADNYTFADLFAGTGVVGAAYKARGCTVIANDIQYYAYVLNKHYLENSWPNSRPQDEQLLAELNSLPPQPGFIYQNYCAGSGCGRNYFTDQNGQKCDAIRTRLEELKKSGAINSATYFYFLASLLNSIDKYANTASVYGAFLKHIKKAAQREFKLELLPVIPGPASQVYNEDINRLIQRLHGEVLYLDPPYNTRQYCSNYHVLETIARYDNPTLVGKTGLRNSAAQKSLFCSKKTVLDAFEALIAQAQFQYIFLSYNNEGLMSLPDIKRIMSKYGVYSVYTQTEYKRFQADREENRRIAAKSTTEYLHCLQKEL